MGVIINNGLVSNDDGIYLVNTSMQVSFYIDPATTNAALESKNIQRLPIFANNTALTAITINGNPLESWRDMSATALTLLTANSLTYAITDLTGLIFPTTIASITMNTNAALNDDFNATGLVNLANLSMTGTALSQANVDATIISVKNMVVAGGQVNGALNLSGGTSAAPSAAGTAAAAILSGAPYNWTVTTN